MGSLTPGEQKEVDEVANAIQPAEAEKMLRSIAELDFDETYKLSSTHLSQVEMPQNKKTVYYLSLYFTKLDNTEGLSDEDIKQKIAIGEGNGYANATLNAKTGELLSFSSNNWAEQKTAKKTSDRAAIKKFADDFIAKYQPEKSKSVKFIDNDNVNFMFQYYRTENGIFFYDNSFNVGVDAESGKIREYYISWFDDAVLPSTQGVITTQKAHEKLFEGGELKLEYVLRDNKVVLGYKLSDQKPGLIDALSG